MAEIWQNYGSNRRRRLIAGQIIPGLWSMEYGVSRSQVSGPRFSDSLLFLFSASASVSSSLSFFRRQKSELVKNAQLEPIKRRAVVDDDAAIVVGHKNNKKKKTTTNEQTNKQAADTGEKLLKQKRVRPRWIEGRFREVSI